MYMFWMGVLVTFPLAFIAGGCIMVLFLTESQDDALGQLGVCPLCRDEAHDR